MLRRDSGCLKRARVNSTIVRGFNDSKRMEYKLGSYILCTPSQITRQEFLMD